MRNQDYVRQISLDTNVEIPITVDVGYRLTVVNNTTHETLFDSEDSYYMQRSYNLTFDGSSVNSDQDISITFERLDTKTLDYTHYTEEAKKEPGESQYHGSTLIFNSNRLDANDSPAEKSIQDGSNTLTITQDTDDFILNALAVNGVTVTVPDDPDEPSRNSDWWNSETASTSSGPVSTDITDINGDVIATVTVEAEASYASPLFSTSWSRTSITYTITFTDVKTNLTITNCNLTSSGDYTEARLRNIGQGVSGTMVNGSNVSISIAAGNALYNFPVSMTLVPDFGHYVTAVIVDDGSQGSERPLAGESWYGTRTTTIEGVDGAVNYVDIETDKIVFRFAYVTDDDGNTQIGASSFTLGIDDIMSSSLEEITPENKDGMTFVGWMLAENSDAYYASDSVGISRDMLQNADITYGQGENAGTATIKLYPKYVDSNEAESTSYTVNIYKDGIVYQTVTGDTRPIGSYIQREAVLELASVKEVVEELTADGYVLDGNSSDTRVELGRTGTVFNLYYKKAEVTVTFVSAYGFSDGHEGTEVTGYYSPGDNLTVPKPVESSDGKVFVGWSTNGSADSIVTPVTAPDESCTYTAVYEDQVKITFVSEYGFEGDVGSPYETLQTPGKTLEAPTPKDTNDDGVVFAGWSADGINETGLPERVPEKTEDGYTYTALYKDDTNNDGKADDEEQKYSISYVGGETGGVEVTNLPATVENVLHGTTQTVSEDEPAADGYVFAGWSVEPSDKGIPTEGGATFEMPENNVTFTAQWKVDENHDGIADNEQTTVTIDPVTTVAYSGDGEGGDGFPALELEVDLDGGRFVDNSAVKAITINGYTFAADGDEDVMNTYLEALYVTQDENGNFDVATNDQKGGEYLVIIAVKAAAREAFGDGYYVDETTGLIRNSNGRYVTLLSAENVETGVEPGELDSIGITAVYEDERGTVDYYVKGDMGTFYVRETSVAQEDTQTAYRDIVTSEAEITDDDQATAIVADGTSFYTNGDTNREVSSDGIQLLSDSIIDDAAEEALLSRAYAEAGNNSDEYEDLVRYFDLVDSYNGNAWVGTADGVTVKVYVPYSALSEAVDPDTIEVYHFEGLHRDGTNDGKIDVASAAGWDKVEEIKIEKAENGFYIETESFSPFIIMWKLNDNGEDNTPGDNTGDNTPGDNTGGNGGGDSDSDGGSSSPGAGPGASGSTYTAGVDGHWVHMDPDNIMIPISEDVPEGATPVTAPQWHQWKFILNNGMMLYDQWAYVKNPYAIGDQPDEGWFSFAENGIMEYGWYLDERTGKWYWMHRTSDGMLGTMLTGWHFDEQDGKWYYMSPRSGEMLLGWQEIDGKWYYFNPYAPAATWEFNEATGGWTYNGANSRPYGSMYANETTPDGYTVGEDGAWIQ